MGSASSVEQPVYGLNGIFQDEDEAANSRLFLRQRCDRYIKYMEEAKSKEEFDKLRVAALKAVGETFNAFRSDFFDTPEILESCQRKINAVVFEIPAIPSPTC